MRSGCPLITRRADTSVFWPAWSFWLAACPAPACRLALGYVTPGTVVPQRGDRIRNGRSSNVIDSPVLAGRHARIEQLEEIITLTIIADRHDQLPVAPGVVQLHRNLVAEADALFGRHPFERYEFLMCLSDHVGGTGLEHRASSENRIRATYFSDWERSTTEHDLLPHEYCHSWIGKYRVPAGNLTRYFTAMTNELMWVYEGLTQFYGHVLAARSGLISPAHTREAFALIFATYDARPGRRWRPLADTEMDPIFTAREPQLWRSWQRSEDYYSEGLLIWLEADMLPFVASNSAVTAWPGAPSRRTGWLTTSTISTTSISLSHSAW